MSVVEQGGGSKPDGEMGVPEFPIGLRGYDRQQVDVFVNDLTIRLASERLRADQAERAVAQMRAEVAGLRDQQAPPSFEHLGAEAARILEQAGQSAKVLVAEARSRGQELIQASEAHAAELVRRAEQRSAELEAEATDTLAEAGAERERILAEASRGVEEARSRAEEEVRAALEQAREEADHTRQKAMTDQAIMRGETERLRESRGRMLEYLGRIHTDLGELLSEAARADVELATPPGGQPADIVDEGAEVLVPNGEHGAAAQES
jgi:cell division septum initiation protein DivIVA